MRRLLRWLLPSLLTAGLFAALVAQWTIPGAWLVGALIVASGPSAAIVVILVLVAGLVLVHRTLGRACALAVTAGLAVVSASAAVPLPERSLVLMSSEVVSVLLHRDELKRQLERLRRQGIAPPVAAAVIDGFGSMARGLALDPSGQIALPVDRRSPEWNRAVDAELLTEGFAAHRVFGDYYAWFHY